MVVKRDASKLKSEIRRIKQNIISVNNSDYTAEEKASLLHIYGKQQQQNERKLASFSKNRNK